MNPLTSDSKLPSSSPAGVDPGAAAAAPGEPSPHQDALSFDQVGITFQTPNGPVQAVDEVNFAVGMHQFVSLLGPSGCGKSTLLRVAADLVEATAGTVTVMGKTPDQARRDGDLSFVFQEAALLPWRTVLANVNLPLEIRNRQGDLSDAADPRELLEMVGLGDRIDALPQELSGGMRQRVSIARALVTRPRLLLMDEPFGALDEITRETMNKELLRIWRETGTSILFVTHSISEAVFLSQQITVLSAHPGNVVGELSVEFSRERDYDLKDSPEFNDLASQARHLLHGGN